MADLTRLTLGGHLQALLGCEWGRAVWTEDDSSPCSERACQIVVLHDGDEEAAFKLCPTHRDRILRETTPRA